MDITPPTTTPPTTTTIEGGAPEPAPAPVSEGLCNKMTGGKRKLTEWNKFVLKIFREHRKTNKKYSYGEALKEASVLKKSGKMSMKKEPKMPAKKSGKKSGKKTAKKSMKCKREYV
jgi:hypothetical protein